MATNSCVKYPFCVEWTTQIPFEFIPRTSQIIVLEGIECNLELAYHRELLDTPQGNYYYLNIRHKSDERKVLNKVTVTTFIRDSSSIKSKLIECCTIYSNNSNTIWKKYKREILAEIPNIIIDGKLTIVCVFHSTGTDLDKNHSAHVSGQTTLDSIHLHSLSLDFSILLKDGTFSDVKLICGDRTFSANRSVLAARSEVFAAMFRSMAETDAGVVKIKDIDPEMLELLLKYVYSAEIPHLSEETAICLYEAADKCAVYGLRQACSDWMVVFQTTDNCLDLLVLANKYSDENFKEAVARFVAEHLADLSVESWSTFRNNYPQLVLSVLEKRCEDSIPVAAKRARSGT